MEKNILYSSDVSYGERRRGKMDRLFITPALDYFQSPFALRKGKNGRLILFTQVLLGENI
jgi:hypothetical protein